MSKSIFLHIYVKGRKEPLLATLNKFEDMEKTSDGFYLVPSTRGRRFMIAADTISWIEVQENRQG